MEYLLIIAFVLLLYIFNNAWVIKKLKEKYFAMMAAVVFPFLFYFTVYKDFSIWKLLLFGIIVIVSIYNYIHQKRKIETTD